MLHGDAFSNNMQRNVGLHHPTDQDQSVGGRIEYLQDEYGNIIQVEDVSALY